ncbi:hypothetical protein GCM10010218_03400 [Streptomyces mashuensis]|uniref:Uncharacterized protein n=1 Tax=Streptomyces mashuensis TaxID=33904 RepID=A0A919E8T2_9ACTN|nr:DUF5955 family protein [Streptomyces mashuensis]GHF26001.1 hypothetical protein GCM10010218_03400 [Streptomyces mashuensis]
MTEGAVAVEPAVEREHVTRCGQEPDPRAGELGQAVSRLRRALAGHPAVLPDRDAAEDELAALDAMARAGTQDVSRLRRSLLLVAGAVGSVSALAPALGEVRAAVERFADDPAPEPGVPGQREGG